MIVVMKKLGLHIVEQAIGVFKAKGFDVFVKNDEAEPTLAVMGKVGREPSRADAANIFGVKKCTMDNRLFVEEYQNFEEAGVYISSRDADEEVAAG
jgi:hypothetical protein